MLFLKIRYFFYRVRNVYVYCRKRSHNQGYECGFLFFVGVSVYFSSQ